MIDRTVFARRLALVASASLTALALIAGRVVYLGAMAAHGAPLAAGSKGIPAQRGNIWDREGGPVAITTYLYEVAVARNEIRSPEAVISALASATGRAPDEVQATIAAAPQDWIVIAKAVSAEQGLWLRRLQMPGIHVTSQPGRAYPLGPAAAHLTGFLSAEPKGYYGLEGYYERELAGREGQVVGRHGTDPRSYKPPQPGVDLVLTIDRELQLAAAGALANVVDQQQASGGSVLVLDPRSGAILASTSLPSYDPVAFLDAEETTWLDPAVAQCYEPGSTMKAMTTAAALDSGAVGLDYAYDDQGFVDYAGLRITNWDHLSHGPADLTAILRHSLNVGAVHLAIQLGAERFYSYLAAFGFGSPTGVDLAGEPPGIVHSPSNDGAAWYQGHLATNSFGQGVAASLLQVARAMAAIANDGALMAPYVVAARIGPDGRVERTSPRFVRQVITPATARAVRELLEVAVAEGVPQARLAGYSVAGKTGTSQIPSSEGPGYDPNLTIASFVGFLPAEDPSVLVAVKVDRPRAVRGSDVAAPLFRMVAAAAVQELGIPPTHEQAALTP